jgi:hypothetical protein
VRLYGTDPFTVIMMQKAFSRLLILNGVNIVVFFVCRTLLIGQPGAGPEGIGTGLLLYASVLMSVFFAGYGLNEILKETGYRILKWKTLVVTFIGAIPLAFYLLVDILPLRFKSAH